MTKRLNVVGREAERNLTAVIRSAKMDGDVEAAFRGGMALRNMLIARIYTQRFLIQNDQASYERVRKEFKELEKSQAELEASLENPVRQKLAWSARRNSEAYAAAIDEVHATISEHNEIIRGTLDRIGPQVAKVIEQLKLAIKADQDSLGPNAEAALRRAVTFALVASLLAIGVGLVLAALIGLGISRPVQS